MLLRLTFFTIIVSVAFAGDEIENAKDLIIGIVEALGEYELP